MIKFLTLFFGLITGLQPVAVTVDGSVAEVEVRIDGRVVGTMLGEPWEMVCDFGDELAPHELVAVARDVEGREIARDRQWVNLPRSRSEAQLSIEVSPDGRRIARVRWYSIDQREPDWVEVTFGGEPLLVEDPRRFELPLYDPNNPHLLVVALRFGATLARAQMLLGGAGGEEVTSDLTALPVILAGGGRPPGPDEMAGWFVRDGEALEVVAVESAGADVLMVTDPAKKLRYRLEGLGRGVVELQTARTPGGMSAAVMLPTGFGPRDRFQLMSPVGERHPTATEPVMHFPMTANLASRRGGIIASVTEPRPWTEPSERARVQVADAVAVAGLAAAGGGRARVVVVIVGRDAADGSRFSAAEVQAYLQRIHVPLFVWSPYTPRDDGVWDRPRDISKAWRLVRAVDDLRSFLDRQIVVWLAGRHPAHRVHLSPEGRNTLQLAGEAATPSADPDDEEGPSLVAGPDGDQVTKPGEVLDPDADDPVRFSGDTIEVRVVNLDVVASDGSGRRITDLERHEFTVTEDGAPVEISHFVPPEVPPSENVEDREDRSVPVATVESEIRPFHLVVMYDTTHIRPGRRGPINKALVAFLGGGLPASSRIMLVTHEGAMRIRQTFSGSPDAAIARVEELGDELAGYAAADEERRAVHDEILQVKSELDQARQFGERSDIWAAEAHRDQVVSEIRLHAESIRHDLRNAIGVLRELASSLGGVSGRKLLLYVGDELTLDPAGDIYFNALRTLDMDAIQSRTLEMEQHTLSLRPDFDELVGLANANGVTFYTLTPPSTSVFEIAGMPSAGSMGLRTSVQSEYEAGTRQALCFMSDGSGGRCQVAAGDPGLLLAEVVDDIESTYRLAYSPDHPSDGKYHRIEVRVTRRGVKLRHREGYLDTSADQRLRDHLAAALRFDAEDNPLEIELTIEHTRPLSEDRFLVPLKVKVPLSRLALVPDSSGRHHVCRARLLVMTAGADGRTAGVKEFPVSFEVDAGRVASSEWIVYAHDVHLTLEPGVHEVAIGLWDEVGKVGSFIRRTIEVSP